MWFLYAFFFALWSTIGIFITKHLTKEFGALALLYIIFLFYLPCTFIAMLLTGGVPHVSQSFFIYMLISAVLDTAAFIFSFKAIKLSPISLIAPIMSFAPVFTTIIAITTLGESPTPIKFVGILLIVIGVYLLNASDIKEGIFLPIKNLVKDKGVQFAFASTVIWSITPIFQKKALLDMSPKVPLFASFTGILLVTIFLTPLAYKRAWRLKNKIPFNFKWLMGEVTNTCPRAG